MKTTRLQLLVPLALTMGASMPALAQDTDPATQQFNTICEIDLEVLPITFDEDETTLFTTFDTRTLCTGSLASENIKRECEKQIPDWTRGAVSASGFECTINPDFCDVIAAADDPNAPAVTATESQLDVDASGLAMLTCFYKP